MLVECNERANEHARVLDRNTNPIVNPLKEFTASGHYRNDY